MFKCLALLFVYSPSIDVHAGNLLACENESDNAKFKRIEESEMTSPSARK